MKKFFYPKSLAVVGVSETPDNLARGIVSNLLQFNYQGKIFLVGARPGATFDRPIFPSLRDLPEPVDLAVILAPARVIPALLKDCGELGISRVVVESAGFSEMGESGRALEDEVRALLKKYRLRLIGPNGLGCLNMEIGLALPFAQVRPLPRLGHISIIAQSGGVATHLMAWMTREGLGLNKFLSLGNKLDVARKRGPGLFPGGPGHRRGLCLSRRGGGRPGAATGGPPGHQARVPARWPTWGRKPRPSPIPIPLPSPPTKQVLAAACRQSGMVHLKDQADFLSLAKLVGQPPVKGDRLVVFSRSGGQAVVAAYACRRFGFRLPPLSAPLVEFIRDHSRAGVIHPGNPIDLGDIFDFSVYTGVMEAVCRDPEVDAVLLHYGPMAEFEIPAGRDMAAAHHRTGPGRRQAPGHHPAGHPGGRGVFPGNPQFPGVSLSRRGHPGPGDQPGSGLPGRP